MHKNLSTQDTNKVTSHSENNFIEMESRGKQQMSVHQPPQISEFSKQQF